MIRNWYNKQWNQQRKALELGDTEHNGISLNRHPPRLLSERNLYSTKILTPHPLNNLVWLEIGDQNSIRRRSSNHEQQSGCNLCGRIRRNKGEYAWKLEIKRKVRDEERQRRWRWSKVDEDWAFAIIDVSEWMSPAYCGECKSITYITVVLRRLAFSIWNRDIFWMPWTKRTGNGHFTVIGGGPDPDFDGRSETVSVHRDWICTTYIHKALPSPRDNHSTLFKFCIQCTVKYYVFPFKFETNDMVF